MKRRKFGFVLMSISSLLMIGSYMYATPTVGALQWTLAYAKSAKQIYEPRLSELKVILIPSVTDKLSDQEALKMGFTQDEVDEYRKKTPQRTKEYSIEYRNILITMISMFLIGLYLFIFPRAYLGKEPHN